MARGQVDRALQRGLVIAYGLLTAAAVSSILYTPPSMEETIGGTGANLWGVLTLLGSSACLGGVLVRRGARWDWFGEFIGIWALAGGVIVYACVVASTLENQPGRLAGTFLLFALGVLLIVRWFRVFDDGKTATAPRPPTRE